MTFLHSIEQWRATVVKALASVYADFPKYQATAQALGISDADMTDTLLAIIQKESSGDYLAEGDNGDSVGLFMLNYGAGTPQFLGYTGTKIALKDPALNSYYGAKYFLYQLDRYRDRDTAILAYNAGSLKETAAGVPINQSYLDQVLTFLGEKKTSSRRSSPPPPSSSSLGALAVADSGDVVPVAEDPPAPSTDPITRPGALAVALVALLHFFPGC